MHHIPLYGRVAWSSTYTWCTQKSRAADERQRVSDMPSTSTSTLKNNGFSEGGLRWTLTRSAAPSKTKGCQRWTRTNQGAQPHPRGGEGECNGWWMVWDWVSERWNIQQCELGGIKTRATWQTVLIGGWWRCGVGVSSLLFSPICLSSAQRYKWADPGW